MADLKRKAIALFFTVVMVLATVAITGCGGDDTGKTNPPPEKKLPDME